MAEKWRKIKEIGYDADTDFALFEVSSLGRVRKTDGGLLPIHLRQNDTRVVILKTKTERRFLAVHILVASAFLKKPVNAKQLKHKDNDKANNSADNLYWSCEPIRINGGSGRRAKPVRVYSIDRVLLGEFAAVKDAATALSVSGPAIGRCCNGVDKAYLGLVWKFVESDDWFVKGMKPACDLAELVQLCSTRQSGSPRCAIRRYDLNGNLVSEGKTADSWRAEGVDSTVVLKCCTRAQLLTNNHTYRYVIDDELFAMSKEERVDALRQMNIDSGKSSYVRQYTLDGRLVGEYSSIVEASGGNEMVAKKISAVCSKMVGHVTVNGYVWRRALSDDLYSLSIEARKTAISSLPSRPLRHIRQYTKEGVFIAEYRSSREAARYLGCSDTAISRCCKSGSNRMALGFKWRWENDDEFAIKG